MALKLAARPGCRIPHGSPLRHMSEEHVRRAVHLEAVCGANLALSDGLLYPL